MPLKSKSQRRWMWANDPEMARRWEDHTPKGKKLPEHVKKAFVIGFAKTAVIDLPDEARYGALVPMQDYVPGRNMDKETGQRRKVNTRTEGVRNEDREFSPAIKHEVENARVPKVRS